MKYTLSILREQLAAKNHDVKSIIYREEDNDPGISGYDPEHIEHWFSKFRLTGVKGKPEKDALYIYQAGEDMVTLSHGPFSFNVIGAEYNRVCEDVVEICQRLSVWEKDLYEMAWRNADYQAMIDRSDAIFDNPIFVCNWQGRVHGFTEKYENEKIRSTWQAITHDRRVPVSALTAIMSSEYRRYLSQENSVHILDFSEAGHRAVFGLVHVNSEIVLQFQIIEYNKRITVADLELAQIFLDALRRSFRENEMAKHESSLDVFRQLIDGDVIPDDSIEWALDYLGWKNLSNSFNLLFFRQQNGDSCKSSMFSQVERHLPGARIIEYKDDMIMILPTAVLEGFPRELKYILNTFRFFAGVSLPFSDWRLLPESYSQAVSSETHCSPDMPICYGLNYAWVFVMDSIVNRFSEAGLIHPAVTTLAEYDRENQTDFVHTLYTYIACERSNVDTAAALFIHRNTLKYRLSKIQELIDVDLDDVNTRMHLFISLQITGC